MPGRGDIDEIQNNHANLHGAMIGRGYVNAQILVSPAEVNSKVVACATYNMNRINPATDCYWDPIDQAGAGSGGNGGDGDRDGNCGTWANRSVCWRSTTTNRFRSGPPEPWRKETTEAIASWQSVHDKSLARESAEYVVQAAARVEDLRASLRDAHPLVSRIAGLRAVIDRCKVKHLAARTSARPLRPRSPRPGQTTS